MGSIIVQYYYNYHTNPFIHLKEIYQMKNIPKKIYLQVDADGELPECFDELVGVSWDSERIYDTDIEYVINTSPVKRFFKKLFTP